MKTFILISPFIFAHLYGLFSAFMDARKDYGFMWYNRLYQYCSWKGEDYKRWYKGGNEFYPAGNPFKADFWHWSKHVTSWLISLMVISSILSVLWYPSVLQVSYIFVSSIEGYSFTLYYSWLLRSDRSFKWYLNYIA